MFARRAGSWALPQRWTGDGFVDRDERIVYHPKFGSLQNFGDYLPEIFCKELLLHPRVEADVYRLVGSVIDETWILRSLRQNIGGFDGTVAFWGCGVRASQPLSARVMAKCMFFGVRGPITRDTLGLPPDTVLGDPGLLAPVFHRPRVKPGESGRTICIPHAHDAADAEDLLARSGCDALVQPTIPSSEAALRALLDQIAGAQFVLTGSLHGAIMAFAYQRPFAYWDTGHIDVPVKWRDFSDSVGLPTIFVRSLAEGQEIYAEKLAPNIRRLPLTPILENAPFQARPAALLRCMAADGVIDSGIAEEIASKLDRLPSQDEAEIMRLQMISEAYRGRLRRPLRTVLGHAVLGLQKAKRTLIDPVLRKSR